MRITGLVVAIIVLLNSVAFSQVRAVEAGSAEAARLIAASRARAQEAAEFWRTSKKLTVLDKVPDAPRGQGGCLSVSDLKSDSVGYLEYWQFSVLHVAGPKDMLLTMQNPRIPPIWLTGHASKGLVDGDKVRLVGPIEVAGTKTYKTVSGASKTVRVVQFVSKTKLDEIAAAEKAKVAAAAQAVLDAKAAKDKAAAAKRETEFRKWTSTAGTTIEARFAGLLSGTVILEKRDGKKIKVPINKLSKVDQKFISDKRKKR